MNIILGTAVDETLPTSSSNKSKRFCSIYCVPTYANQGLYIYDFVLWDGTIIFVFFQQVRVWDVERLGHLPKVTWPISGRAGVQAPESMPLATTLEHIWSKSTFSFFQKI